MPINKQLFDNHGRMISYVRLAITDRCNLRCFYCMPEEGIKYLPKKELLTFEEMEHLIRLMASMGIDKVRITGGEPFVRKDLIQFLWRVHQIDGIEQVHITTNGVLTGAYVQQLKDMGISSVNLSLDTIDRVRFKQITRRDELPKVLDTMNQLLEAKIPVKINAVVMENKNTEDIIPLAELARQYPIGVRFIEEMPFNGTGANYPVLTWTHDKILNKLSHQYPTIAKIPDLPNATSRSYQVPGHLGSLGIIAAFSRTFCGSCNRIRVTSQGTLKTCLYDDGVLDLRSLLRGGSSDQAIEKALLKAFAHRAKDGFVAEKNRKSEVTESMSVIGG